MNVKDVPISSEFIQLVQFLKWAGVVSTGGQAKELLANGLVSVNGACEAARGRKLRPGDVIEVANTGRYRVTAGENS